MLACSMAAPARALAAGGALHLVFMVAPAASQPQNDAASARARAEELAEHASRRFSELLEGERAAPAGHARPASLAGPWKEALGWIERSNRDFDVLLRRLAGGEVELRAEAASGPGWLGRARERFEAIMRRLSEGATPPQPPHAAPPVTGRAGTSLAHEVPRAPDAGTIASERPLAERRHAAPPAASPAPGGEAEKTSSDRRPDAKLAAPAAEPQPPARAVPSPATAAARQREASTEKAGEVKRTARSSDSTLPSEAKSAAARPANTTSRTDREATAGGIAAVHTEAKPAAGRAQKMAFAKRRSHRAARAQPPAAASTKAAASSPSHRHARRGVRHRHAKASHACERLGADVALPGWYVVKNGDTLWGISRHHYGNGRRYRRIAAANWRRLHGTNRIHPCERLYLPGVPRG